MLVYVKKTVRATLSRSRGARGNSGCSQRKEENLMSAHYSMVIEWSDEDHAFLVPLPEWVEQVYMPCTHGATNEEAARHGREVLDMLQAHADAGEIPAAPA